MKIFSANAGRARIDRAAAWACTVTNLISLPGLGSIAGGRRVGYLQAFVAGTGFTLTLAGLIAVLRAYYQQGEFTLQFARPLRFALVGIGLFGLGWLWALTTSLSLQREARSQPPEPHAHDSAPPAPPGTRR